MIPEDKTELGKARQWKLAADGWRAASELATPVTAGPAKVVAAVATGSNAFGAPANSEIAEHMNKFLDELKWFRENSVKIHLSPTATGWNLKFSVPEN